MWFHDKNIAKNVKAIKGSNSGVSLWKFNILARSFAWTFTGYGNETFIPIIINYWNKGLFAYKRFNIWQINFWTVDDVFGSSPGIMFLKFTTVHLWLRLRWFLQIVQMRTLYKLGESYRLMIDISWNIMTANQFATNFYNKRWGFSFEFKTFFNVICNVILRWTRG